MKNKIRNQFKNNFDYISGRLSNSHKPFFWGGFREYLKVLNYLTTKHNKPYSSKV